MKLLSPKILLHLEGLAVLAAAVMVYARVGRGWGWFFLAFLVPDLALLGYLAGQRIGAVCYNAVHTYTAPLLLLMILLATNHPGPLWIVLVWTAHIGLDRLVGYGLKYESGAKETHLSRV